MKNSWQVVVEEFGKVIEEKSGPLDPFAELIKKDGASTVNFSVGRSMSYGELKVSASVTLTCDQDNEHINEAGRLAFMKAVELCQDGWSLLTEDKSTS